MATPAILQWIPTTGINSDCDRIKQQERYEKGVCINLWQCDNCNNLLSGYYPLGVVTLFVLRRCSCCWFCCFESATSLGCPNKGFFRLWQVRYVDAWNLSKGNNQNTKLNAGMSKNSIQPTMQWAFGQRTQQLFRTVLHGSLHRVLHPVEAESIALQTAKADIDSWPSWDCWNENSKTKETAPLLHTLSFHWLLLNRQFTELFPQAIRCSSESDRK